MFRTLFICFSFLFIQTAQAEFWHITSKYDQAKNEIFLLLFNPEKSRKISSAAITISRETGEIAVEIAFASQKLIAEFQEMLDANHSTAPTSAPEFLPQNGLLFHATNIDEVRSLVLNITYLDPFPPVVWEAVLKFLDAQHDSIAYSGETRPKRQRKPFIVPVPMRMF